jgi:hypothetical protein
MVYNKLEDIKLPFNEWLHPNNIKIVKPQKIEAFEYFVLSIFDKLVKHIENDLSMIKLQALLFLAMSAYLKNKKDDGDVGLLSIFDNWYAMPYGNIERDILEYHRKNEGQFNGFKINRHSLEVIE